MLGRKRFRVGHVKIRCSQVTSGQRADERVLIGGCSPPNGVVTASGFHRLEKRGVKKMDRVRASRKDINDMIRCRQYRFQPSWSDHLVEWIWGWIPPIAKDAGSERPQHLSQSLANPSQSDHPNCLTTS